MTTLVIGARGSIGRAVLDQLLAHGEPVRASTRDPAAADVAAGVPVAAADLTRPETLAAALDGVHRVFLYALPDGIDNFVKAAEAAGVEHVVVLSSGQVLVPGQADDAIAKEHRLVESALDASALRWTPVRPLALATNALHWSSSIRAEGVVRLVHPDARSAPVHERDVAAVAVAALRGSTDPQVSAVLTGPELLTQRQEVELGAAAIGRPLRVEEVSDAEGRAQLRRFLPPEIADATVDLRAAAVDGAAPLTNTVNTVLGRPPITFAQWARDHAADFR
jgi:uncharacterized protein YbjT (DUF2867 family)